MASGLPRSFVLATFLLSTLALTMPAVAAAERAPCSCKADLDGDVDVDFADLLVLLAQWGDCPGCAADLDHDDVVGFNDLLLLLAGWGPCVFEYGPPRESAEAEQIGLEMLGPNGPLLLADDLYERIERDLALIRVAEPGLADQAHSLAWAPNQLILQKNTGAPPDEYDALNLCFQILDEDNFAFDFWLLTYPGKLNVAALVEIYQDLEHVTFAEPNGFFGGQNFYMPTILAGGVWRWEIDDGFHDCLDGCDCHRLYVFEVDADGNVTLISYEEVGLPWCEFKGP